MRDDRRLFQPLEPSLAANQALVVPLDVPGLAEPALQVLPVDLVGGGEPDFGSLERAFFLQALLAERLPAPEQKAYAAFQLAVSDDRIAVQEPDRVRAPYLVSASGRSLSISWASRSQISRSAGAWAALYFLVSACIYPRDSPRLT